MSGFGPYKKHPNKFNYIPRYYDPEKEAREQRRAELLGKRSEDEEREYRPGQLIRTQREARAARRSEEERSGRRQIWKMMLGVVFMLLIIVLLFPRLARLFSWVQGSARERQEQVVEQRRPVNELDQRGVSDVEWQAQPITVVPNDYQGEE